jgi:hypothetical protein
MEDHIVFQCRVICQEERECGRDLRSKVKIGKKRQLNLMGKKKKKRRKKKKKRTRTRKKKKRRRRRKRKRKVK